MVDNSNYMVKGFENFVRENFAYSAEKLSSDFRKRLSALLIENAGETPEKQRHLKSQILPGIAAYEVLGTVMDKNDALGAVHNIVRLHALDSRRKIEKLLKIPGMYRLVPGIFAVGVKKIFNEAAGFSAREYNASHGVWRMDMIKCPYKDTCTKYGCPELCVCFCDSDDVSYDNLHKKLLWHRTKTLGRGDGCCDFCLKIRD